MEPSNGVNVSLLSLQEGWKVSVRSLSGSIFGLESARKRGGLEALCDHFGDQVVHDFWSLAMSCKRAAKKQYIK